MAKIERMGEDDGGLIVRFECPGCQCSHGIPVKKGPNTPNKHWGWNGSFTSPTFTPSILCNKHDPASRCHSYVEEGRIRFLNDCYHPLAGKTVDLPELE